MRGRRLEPGEAIVFQHAGGGSHATFYDSAVYLGNGQNGSGVGCDNTSEPLRELRLRPVLLPETAPEPVRARSGRAAVGPCSG